MYSVLVPIDRDEERAIAQGEMVRRLPDAAGSVEVTMLHVGAVSDPLDLAAGSRLRELLREADVPVRLEVRDGTPAQAILDVAEEFAVEQIVVGGRKRSPLGTLLFGSTTQEVILHADRPVTVTGAAIKEDPTHRCQDCAEAYYTESTGDIPTCRNCGGTNVEPVQTPWA